MLGITGVAGLMATAQAGAAEVVYREIFSTADGGARVGWKAYNGSEGKKVEFGGSVGVDSNANGGRPGNVTAVNSTKEDDLKDSRSDNLKVGLFTNFDNKSNDKSFFVWTDEYLIVRGQNNLSQISWYQGNAAKDDVVRFAVKIGGQWYVTSQEFTQDNQISSTSGFANNAELMTFTFTSDASAWRELSFTAGSNLSLNSSSLSSDLPLGDITAFGLYVDNKSGTLRFDTYEIQATAITSEQ